MWKTQHVAVLAVTATVLSVALTLYVQSRIKHAIDDRVSEALTGQSRKDPIQLMSALASSKSKKKENSYDDSSIPPKVSFEGLPVDHAEQQKRGPPPNGAGSRWTPL